jgi:hypothetical protein
MVPGIVIANRIFFKAMAQTRRYDTKKVNSLRAENLRTIVLMEADFNFLNKIIGRRIMANAEAARSIAEERFGSRKQKSSILHALNKQLAIEILQQDRKNYSLITLEQNHVTTESYNQ